MLRKTAIHQHKPVSLGSTIKYLSNMEFMKTYLSVALLCLANSVYAAEPAWQLKRDAQGMQIYQKPTDSGYAITRGEVEVNSSIDALVAVIDDRTNCSQWLHACIRGHVKQQETHKIERIDYTVIDAPLWLKDRDMYTQSRGRYNPQTQTFTIQFRGLDDYGQQDPERVRIQQLYGSWVFKRLAPQRTHISYEVHGNPQLPWSSLIDLFIVDSIAHSLSHLNRLAQQTPYKNSYLPYLH